MNDSQTMNISFVGNPCSDRHCSSSDFPQSLRKILLRNFVCWRKTCCGWLLSKKNSSFDRLMWASTLGWFGAVALSPFRQQSPNLLCGWLIIHFFYLFLSFFFVTVVSLLNDTQRAWFTIRNRTSRWYRLCGISVRSFPRMSNHFTHSTHCSWLTASRRCVTTSLTAFA